MSPSKPYAHPSERDGCKVLMDACGPQLYVQNAFRVTGLHVEAGVREYKKHLDNLKGALEFGEKDAGRHTFAPQPFTVDRVRDAAVRISDPQRRFVDEVFWFWPSLWGQSKRDNALAALAKGDKRLAIGIWKALAKTKDAVVAMHNLAVAHHMVALDWELACLKDRKSVTSEQLKKADECWATAFDYWNKIWDDETLWSMAANRVRAIDDPQLTTGFARCVREHLPEAICGINGKLVGEFCRISNMERASTHIATLRARHNGARGVGAILASLAAPFYTRIDTAIKVSGENLRTAPNDGAKRATSLLEGTSEPLGTLEVLLGKDAAEVGEARDEVADAYRSCVIAYANASEDWTTCVDLLEKGTSIPATEKYKKLLSEDLKTVRERKSQKDTLGTCWFCKRNEPDSKVAIEVKMHGDVRRTPTFNGTHVEWRTMTVTVPRCSECRQAHQRGSIICWVCAVIGGIPGTIIFPIVGTIIGAFIGAGIGVAIRAILRPHGISGESTKSEFPTIQNLVRDGWAIGEKPTGVS